MGFFIWQHKCLARWLLLCVLYPVGPQCQGSEGRWLIALAMLVLVAILVVIAVVVAIVVVIAVVGSKHSSNTNIIGNVSS